MKIFNTSTRLCTQRTLFTLYSSFLLCLVIDIKVSSSKEFYNVVPSSFIRASFVGDQFTVCS